MKRLLFFISCLASFSTLAQSVVVDPQTTLTKIGVVAPSVHLKTIDGKDFDLQDARGKVVLLNFFATWCGPCMEEMPHLQDQIWDRFKDRNFIMVAVDREEAENVVKAFETKRQFGFPIACDPKREIYSKFATKYIPRNFLISAKGVIVFQSMGYTEADFNDLIAAIDREIAQTK
jgi:peroxiredoxin